MIWSDVILLAELRQHKLRAQNKLDNTVYENLIMFLSILYSICTVCILLPKSIVQLFIYSPVAFFLDCWSVFQSSSTKTWDFFKEFLLNY